MLKKITVTRKNEDYYSYSEFDFEGGSWVLVGGYGDPRFYDLPEYIQKRHPRRAIKKDGQSYSFYAIENYFPNPAHIGKGWINSQGEEQPDRGRLMFAGW